MRFRTTQLSAAEYEHSGLRMITVGTNNLPGRGDIVVYCPNTQRKNLPIAVLLHGVYGSAWVWSQRGGAAHTAKMLMESGDIGPMVLAMPSDGLWQDGSFYLAHHGYDFGAWIVEDVIDAVRMLIPEAADSNQTAIGGLSMGGFGALRLGARYAEKFCAISAHSAITHLDQAKHFSEFVIPTIPEIDQSVFLTMQEQAGVLPPVRFDCGREDLLIAYNRRLHQDLTHAQIEHDYQEFDGQHEWPYWEEHLKDSLRFFHRHFDK
ncbi:MAG: esterase family protein [Saprospiraceae bacterium]|nr:esterase family protein [Saprospiraceae bacterium]